MLTKGAITKDQEPNPGEHLFLKSRPLHEWKAAEWKGFRARLNTIQMSLLRCDASASIDDIYRGDSEDSAIDEFRSVSTVACMVTCIHACIHDHNSNTQTRFPTPFAPSISFLTLFLVRCEMYILKSMLCYPCRTTNGLRLS